MPPTSQPSTLKCVAVNVNGLRDKRKRLAFFDWLQNQRYDIVMLTETHSRNNTEAQQWVQEGAGRGRPWQGQAFWCHNTQPGAQQPVRGVAVLLKDGVVPRDVEISVQHTDSAGRLLRVGWEYSSSDRWSILAVYAPTVSADRSSFFAADYWDALDAGPANSKMIVGGDFNCALGLADVQPVPGQQASASNRLVGSQNLQTLNSLFGLVDCFGHLHPRNHQPTHYQNSVPAASAPAAAAAAAAGSSSSAQGAGSSSGGRLGCCSGGRIDYLFLSEELVNTGWLKDAAQHARYPSDHRPVSIKLQPPDQPLQGQKRFIFPNELLGNEDYTDTMSDKLSAAISSWQQQQPDGSPVDLWEHIKSTAVVQTQLWHMAFKQQQQQQRRQLRQAVKHAEILVQHNPGDPQVTAALLAAEQQLTDHDVAAAEQRRAATEPLWEVYGESSTYWFHLLGKPPSQSQLISALQQPGSSEPVRLNTTAGVQAAGDILANFFDSATGGLFAAATTDAAAQQDLLAAVDKQLSASEQQQCEGPAGDGTITLEETAAVLGSLPRGKAPGSDGLTYEFYIAFWDQIGQYLVDAFNSIFSSEAQQPQLSQEQCLGLIVLIYKGGGKPREDPDSYRPITLLNVDVKILAKVLAVRYGVVLDSVIDPTQTGFVPGRDIADNVLCHLEEIDYLAAVQQPGCMLFLDFAKAYDRLDRGWLFHSMSALGFPASALRWVQILLQGTKGSIMFNRGFCSRTFDIVSGCAQGSPLSPLLYVIAAQPLAAKCRQVQQSQQQFSSITMPDGTAAPCCHQHADDTTLHAASVGGLKLLLDQAVGPYCKASGGQLNISKSKGLVMGSLAPINGVDPVTGVLFPDTSQDPIRHCGILLSSAGATPQLVDQLFTERLKTITWRISHWARYDLSIIGRCEVAKQVLASCLAYHSQFVAPSEQLLQLIHRRILGFILGKGVLATTDVIHHRASPAAAVASLPKQMGGIAQVDVRAHGMAMRAKVAARLLWPHRHVWKVYMQHSLERSLPGLGMAVLVQQTKPPRSAALNPRHLQYIDAFGQVGLHRHVPHDQMSRQQLSLERLVGNCSVGQPADGEMFAVDQQLPSQCQQLSAKTIGEAAAQMPDQPLEQALQGLVLPAAWWQTLRAAAAVSWEVSVDSAWVKQTSDGVLVFYKVHPSGRLEQQPQQEVPASVTTSTASWKDCCVVDIAEALHPVAVQQRQRQHHRQRPRQQPSEHQQQTRQQQPGQRQRSAQQQQPRPQQHPGQQLLGQQLLGQQLLGQQLQPQPNHQQQQDQPDLQPSLQQQSAQQAIATASAAATVPRRSRRSARERRIHLYWRSRQQQHDQMMAQVAEIQRQQQQQPGYQQPLLPTEQPLLSSDSDADLLPPPLQQVHSAAPPSPPRPSPRAATAGDTRQQRVQQQRQGLVTQRQLVRHDRMPSQHQQDAAAGPSSHAPPSAIPGRSRRGVAAAQQLFLVGAWESVRVDPSVWGFGFLMGVLQYTVRGATQRLLQWQCNAMQGWVPGVGLIPRLWRDSSGALQPQTGLQALESGQKRRWEQMAAGTSRSGSSSSAGFSDEALHQAYDAAWMHPSPVRHHPMQRVADAAAVITAQRQQQLSTRVVAIPAFNDLADPLTGLQQPPEVDAPWLQAYRRLHMPRLPKSLRVFGWRLLHNALWVGARKMYFRPRSECVCQHEQCSSVTPVPLQTLAHVLLECPVAAEVWEWFFNLWRQIDPTSIVVANSQLLLLDELYPEQVSPDLQPLWTHLRLLLLESLWLGRGDPARDRAPQSVAAIKHRFVAAVQQQVSSDWQRTKQDIRWQAGVPASWFRGGSPEMEIVEFEAMWCAGGVLATVESASQTAVATMCFHLTVESH